MGEARDVLDRLTEAVMSGDGDALAHVYADDVTLVTPDQGEVTGTRAAVEYMSQFTAAFPDASWEPIAQHEVGNVAIDEGYFNGTHTGPLPLPDGGTLDPTNRRVRLRECDIAEVENGRVTSHRFYFDQLEFLEQLGLTPES